MNSRILFGSISLLALTALSASVSHVIPAPPYATDALNTADIDAFTSHDTSRIVGNVVHCLARRAPYNDILDGGTISSGISTVQRAVVQERAYLGATSLTAPEFTNDTSMCGQVGTAAETGTTEYQFQLQTKRGMGPLVCVKGMRDEFEGSYMAAEDAIKKQIVHLNNADTRYILLKQSGIKLTVIHGGSFGDMIEGDSQLINTRFFQSTATLPTSCLTFALLEYLGIHMRENLLVDGFEGPQSEPLLKFVGGQDIVNVMRDQSEVKLDHRYLAAGSYSVGKETLMRYRWEGPYRGFAFGVDPQPLRFNEWSAATGLPVLLEPEIAIGASNHIKAVVNPAWARAKFEIAFCIGANSFRRLAPKQYTGEGSFTFPAQVSTGELKFQVIKDNDQNVWGDYGRHFWQISRAIRPERPHAVCPIAFARPQPSFNTAAVTFSTDWSSSASVL